jgi:hypothetical protein
MPCPNSGPTGDQVSTDRRKVRSTRAEPSSERQRQEGIERRPPCRFVEPSVPVRLDQGVLGAISGVT